MSSGEHLFVYGTLRQETRSKMHRVLARYGEFLGEATFQGKLYKVGFYPGLVPSDDPQDVVYGEVYKLRRPNFVLSFLDDYEECGPRFPEPAFVRRKQAVTFKSGEVMNAWVYIFARPTRTLQIIESGDFLRKS
jgi:gamma-glutamylcyclotransferase (GGCT)/AIG2-like uncharacterized protein YtfP